MISQCCRGLENTGCAGERAGRDHQMLPSRTLSSLPVCLETMISPVLPFLCFPDPLTYPRSQVAHADGRIDLSGLEGALEALEPSPLLVI